MEQDAATMYQAPLTMLAITCVRPAHETSNNTSSYQQNNTKSRGTPRKLHLSTENPVMEVGGGAGPGHGRRIPLIPFLPTYL